MERDEIRARLDDAYAARLAGDAAKVRELCRADATFEVVGTKSLIAGYPAAGPMGLADATEAIMQLVTLVTAEPTLVLIDGHQAAVRLRATVSLGGLEPVETELCHLWEFDEEGRIRSVTEFVDTALLVREMAALQ